MPLRTLLSACALALLLAHAPAAAADPILATIAYAGGANRNLPVSVTTTATESAVVFTTSPGDNPVIQYTCDQAWTWLAIAGSATASLPVAANQTLTLQLDGGATATTHYVQRQTANGTLRITRLR
jgi:hypothetical protein